MKGFEMKFVKRILMIILNFLLLYLLISVFKIPHKETYNSKDSFIFSKGNAPQEIRSEIIQQLQMFQEGYVKRDTSQVEYFMKRLFSQQNIVILATMPNEIFSGYNEAARVIRSDWASWGDCRFLVDNANISTFKDVAWFSTIGFVKFDLSRFLILPLRLSGVMVKENNVWKFQQLQFQFDLDFSFILLMIVVLMIVISKYIILLAITAIQILSIGKD
jgi:hypothetical protein